MKIVKHMKHIIMTFVLVWLAFRLMVWHAWRYMWFKAYAFEWCLLRVIQNFCSIVVNSSSNVLWWLISFGFPFLASCTKAFSDQKQTCFAWLGTCYLAYLFSSVWFCLTWDFIVFINVPFHRQLHWKEKHLLDSLLKELVRIHQMQNQR